MIEWKKIKKLDPSEKVKQKYELKGWKAELFDLVFGFACAALLYYLILPFLLGATPPAVVVQSCSMKGALNVGEVVVLKGASFEEINAPTVQLDSEIDFSVVLDNQTQETTKLIFSDNQTLDVQENGDTVVYTSKISGEQIIHRVIAKVQTPEGRYYLTKGDANNLPDAVRLECTQWDFSGQICQKLRINGICTENDIGYGGCIATPVKEQDIAGRQFFSVPLIGHVKMIAMHIVTLGHGYPGPAWC